MPPNVPLSVCVQVDAAITPNVLYVGPPAYSKSHVVTAGSPIGLISARVPRTVQVLALENDGDVVPHVDGRANDPAVNVTTVTVHHNHHDVLADHSLHESYLPGAADADASPDRSVTQFRASAGAFFTASSVSTRTYAVTRQS